MRCVLLLQLYQQNINWSDLSWVSTSFISSLLYKSMHSNHSPASKTHLGHKQFPPNAPLAHSLRSLTSNPISQ